MQWAAATCRSVRCVCNVHLTDSMELAHFAKVHQRTLYNSAPDYDGERFKDVQANACKVAKYSQGRSQRRADSTHTTDEPWNSLGYWIDDMSEVWHEMCWQVRAMWCVCRLCTHYCGLQCVMLSLSCKSGTRFACAQTSWATRLKCNLWWWSGCWVLGMTWQLVA